jgi:predicted nucleic acid-binding protein
MDDKDGQREARKRGLRPVWMLTVLDEAAARGLVSDLSERLDDLLQNTSL